MNVFKLSLIFFVCLLHCVYGHDDKFLICKPVSNTFDSTNDTSTNNPPVHVQGKRGAPGPPGPPGVVDYERINLRIRGELQHIFFAQKCPGGVVVGRTCYKLLYRVGYRVQYEEARSLCNFHESILAEIPTQEVYDAVFHYIQSTWTIDISNKVSTYVDVWLGSDVFQNGDVILRDGEAGFSSWFPGHPNGRAGHNRLALDVPIKPERNLEHKGMFNINPEYGCVPLCEFNIN